MFAGCLIMWKLELQLSSRAYEIFEPGFIRLIFPEMGAFLGSLGYCLTHKYHPVLCMHGGHTEAVPAKLSPATELPRSRVWFTAFLPEMVGDVPCISVLSISPAFRGLQMCLLKTLLLQINKKEKISHSRDLSSVPH